MDTPKSFVLTSSEKVDSVPSSVVSVFLYFDIVSLDIPAPIISSLLWKYSSSDDNS